jgi:hypothetical protein
MPESRVAPTTIPRCRGKTVLTALTVPRACGSNERFGDVGEPFGRDKNCEARRGEKRCNEIPRLPTCGAARGLSCAERIDQLVPSTRSRPFALEPVAAGGMKLRVRIGGVEHIRVDGEHLRLSMEWYRASRSAHRRVLRRCGTLVGRGFSPAFVERRAYVQRGLD